VLLILLGVLSRLFSLEVLRRVSSSPARDVTPSRLPGTPWFTLESDREALKVVVVATYGCLLLEMLLVLIGVLA
jgi:hypothetical protein